MKPSWQTVPRDHVRGQWAALYITLNPKGEIVMSRVTYERLGAPGAFHILFDTVNNRIGLKPTSPSLRNAYPAAKHGSHGGRMVRAFRMMQDFAIDLPDTVRFHDAEIDEEGILILDLRSARVSERAANHYRNRTRRQNRQRP